MRDKVFLFVEASTSLLIFLSSVNTLRLVCPIKLLDAPLLQRTGLQHSFYMLDISQTRCVLHAGKLFNFHVMSYAINSFDTGRVVIMHLYLFIVCRTLVRLCRQPGRLMQHFVMVYTQSAVCLRLPIPEAVLLLHHGRVKVELELHYTVLIRPLFVFSFL